MATIKYYGRPGRTDKRPPFVPPDPYEAVTFQRMIVLLRGQVCSWTGQPVVNPT